MIDDFDLSFQKQQKKKQLNIFSKNRMISIKLRKLCPK